MAQSTSAAGEGHDHGTSSSTTTTAQQPESATIAVEMTNIDNPSNRTAGESGGLLNDVSIPTTSPIDSSFPGDPKEGNTNLAEHVTEEEPKAGEASPPAELNPTAMASPSNASNNPLSTSTESATASASLPESSSPPAITRLDSVAIGPSTDETSTPVTSEPAGPVLVITLLLTSGARHPYKIDERYLTKRNVAVPEMTENGKKDPFSISVYTLKELILREWREEWEVAPSSPSSIRLIYFGRLLDDKVPLKECRFNTETANVIHMTVRPQDIVDDEEASKGKNAGRDRGENESQGGCRCVIL